MANIDRLIEAWEIFRDSNPYEICDGKEFLAIKEPEYCMGQMIEDTLELLKEQKPKTGNWIDSAGDDKCSICGATYSDLYPDYSRTHYCPNCGAKMTEGL
jgi:rubredoxin